MTNTAVTTTGHIVSDTTAVYDKLARPTSKTEQAQAGSGSSAAQTTSYTYDKDGQQATQTDASGTTSVQRDLLERVTTQTPPAGSAITYGYDAAGHTVVNSNGVTTTTTTYDPLWRVSSEQVKDAQSGATEQTTSYAYDANGNPLNPITTYANGTQSGVTYTYDKLGRIATMSDGTRNYTYDGNGNLSSMQVLGTSGTPVVEEDFSYDGANRPAGLTDKVGTSGATLHTYSYSYTQAGNAGSITTDGVTTSYTFDTANELTQTSVGTNTTTYAYDANHNRASMVTSAGKTSYGYDSSDTELTSKTDPNQKQTTYAYDSSGNLATATYDPTGANQQTAYHYDTTGRLSEIDKPDGSKVQYTYDADGNRTSTTNVSGGPVPTQTQVRDVYQAGRIAYETDGAGTTLATFSYDPNGTPTSVVLGTDPTNGPRYYYVYNGHGDVVALTDTSGNVVASYSYGEWGNLTSSTESFPNDPENWTNPYRYDGRDDVRYDPAIGLYWMSVRAYDPTLGRFISRDPLGRQPLQWGTQPYVYAGNNPLANVDPSGQRFYDPNDPASAAVMNQQMRKFGTIIRTTAGKDGSSTHTPGCKGTTQQCSDWALAQIGYASGLEFGLGLLQLAPQLTDAAFNIVSIFFDKNAGLIKTIGRWLSVASDLLAALSGFLSLLQSTGHNTSGLRHWVDIIGGAISALTSLYHLLQNGISWLVEMIVDAGWNFITNVIETFGWFGIILLFVGMVMRVDLDTGKDAVHYALVSAALFWESSIASTQSESIDQFCSTHLSNCLGY